MSRGITRRTGVTLLLGALALLLLLAACDRFSPDEDPVSPNERAVQEPIESQAEAAEWQGLSQFPLPSGHDIYERNCSVCHGRDGDGNLGPALAGNLNLASSVYVVARIQLGGGGMPPFARLLSSEEIAAAATFVRTSWENDFGSVGEEQVELQWSGYRRGMRYGTSIVPDR